MKANSLVTLCLTLFFTTTLFAVNFTNTPYLTGNHPTAVASADINRDGFPDLIAVDKNDILTVMLGSSTGHFTISSNLTTDTAPESIVAGDFNGDGYPDVVVLEEQGFELFVSTHNGGLAETFLRPITGGQKIVALDLNGDHIPDIAFTTFTESCSLYAFLNNGHGVFTASYSRSLTCPIFNGSLVAADFNRDGHDDLAEADNTNVHILRSNNNGTFSQTATLTVSGNIGISGLAAGDIDAANGADLILQAAEPPDSTGNFHQTAYVYLNNGSGTLVRKSQIDMENDSGGSSVLVDITGDNRLDLVHVDSDPNRGDLVYARYTGSGTFAPLTHAGGFDMPVDLIGRDFNRDSRHDLAVSAFEDATWTLLNTSATTVCPPPSSASLAAKLCSITKTGTNTFVVRGSGNSPVAVRRVELWVDGKKIFDSPDDQLKRTITLASGTHRVVVQAVEQFGLTAKAVGSVTVP